MPYLLSHVRFSIVMTNNFCSIVSGLGKHFTMGADFCLSDLLDLELHKFVSDVEETVELSSKVYTSYFTELLCTVSSCWFFFR